MTVITSTAVMRGQDPRIHVLGLNLCTHYGLSTIVIKTWVRGSSPRMTAEVETHNG